MNLTHTGASAPDFLREGRWLMAKIDIVFQAGFKEDEAVVEVNDSKFFACLSTDYSIGLAQCISIEEQAGKAFVRIEIPTRNQSISLEVDLKQDVAITVNLTPEGTLLFEQGPLEKEFY